jgi:uncharacterized protein (DUF427 family)
MTLTSGRGPLSPHRLGRFTEPVPDGVAYIEPYERRVRGMVEGVALVDSEAVLLLHRPGHPPTYAFPVADVSAGVATEPAPGAEGYVTVPWTSLDAWFEEDQLLQGHYPRNPYHRVDCLPTSRYLRVEVGGTVLVEITGALGLYETALAPKLYVARHQVRMDLLVPSETTTYCGYKGHASYWHAVVDGVRHDDVAWSYEEPFPESSAIAGLLSFDPDRATVVHDLPEAR